MKQRIEKLQPCFNNQPNPSKKCIRTFRDIIYGFYRSEGRNLPWRRTRDPYAILVSEVMLQQTQVDRVIEPFNRFIRKYPTPKTLAKASTQDVIRHWQGLGYNRRALNLQRAAKMITEHGMPESIATLTTLPGIGPYTARAIMVFAYNEPGVVIETNIRSVFIVLAFPDREKVEDNDITPYIEATMDTQNPREWFNALMDAGAVLKKEMTNPARASRSYKKQSPFPGSDREIRGYVLRELAREGGMKKESLIKNSCREKKRVERILFSLKKEGFLQQEGDTLSLAH